MQHLRVLGLALFGFVLSSLLQEAGAEPEDTSPWRRSDRTYVELCFDGLDNGSPKFVRATSVTDSSLATASINLIGLTLTNRPIYHGAIEHPVRFRSLLVQMPGTSVWAKIDAPNDLPRYIDTWREVPISLCTADDRADFKVLYGTPLGQVECPNLGMHVSMKVASGSEQSLEILRMKDKGPAIYNGLRGCREFVYGPKK